MEDDIVTDESADEILICYICGITFASVQVHNVHSCVAPDFQPIACFFCPKTFLSYRCWHLHENSAHKQDILQMQLENSDEKKETIFKHVREKNCKAYKAKRKLQEQDQNSPPEKQMKIEIVYFNPVKSEEELDQQDDDAGTSSTQQSKSRDSSTNKVDPENRMRCAFCDKHFYNMTTKMRHELSHAKTENHCCLFCGMQFFDRGAMESHERVHQEDIAKKCRYCPKVFANQKRRLSHEKRVHVAKRFICDHCDKPFKTNSDRDRHEQIHSAVRLQQCCDKEITNVVKVCDKESRTSLAKKTHKWTHVNNKPFSCKFCDRRFVSLKSKVTHETDQHDHGKLFKCQFCPITFQYRKSKLQHEHCHRGGVTEVLGIFK